MPSRAVKCDEAPQIVCERAKSQSAGAGRLDFDALWLAHPRAPHPPTHFHARTHARSSALRAHGGGGSGARWGLREAARQIEALSPARATHVRTTHFDARAVPAQYLDGSWSTQGCLAVCRAAPRPRGCLQVRSVGLGFEDVAAGVCQGGSKGGSEFRIRAHVIVGPRRVLKTGSNIDHVIPRNRAWHASL